MSEHGLQTITEWDENGSGRRATATTELKYLPFFSVLSELNRSVGVVSHVYAFMNNVERTCLPLVLFLHLTWIPSFTG